MKDKKLSSFPRRRESSFFQGSRILIVRPPRDGDPLLQALSEAGFEVHSLPVMAIQPKAFDDAVIKQQILNIDLYQKVIVLSRHAASLGIEWLDNFWSLSRNWPLSSKKLPVLPQWFAVGTTTAKILKESGLDVITPTEATSEGLLALPQLQSVAGEKILLLRGEGGRTLLSETLVSRGAQVETCELYRRVSDYQQADRLCRLIESQAVDKIVVHSGEILDCLLAVADGDSVQSLRKLPLLVPSERVAQKAKDQGFEQVIQAKSALPGDMATALLQLK